MPPGFKVGVVIDEVKTLPRAEAGVVPPPPEVPPDELLLPCTIVVVEVLPVVKEPYGRAALITCARN